MSIRVFIVDDSAVVRKVLAEIISAASGIEVMGTAADPLYAQPKMEKDWPDVILLDVEMPRMDGITFLEKIMKERPTPVIMCSTLTVEGSKTSLQALHLGAIDVVAKPKANLKTTLPEASKDLLAAIRIAAKANMAGATVKPVAAIKIKPEKKLDAKAQANVGIRRGKLTADAMLSKGGPNKHLSGPVIAIGASTGGTLALEVVLAALPARCLPILIVQHMPPEFTRTFAERLNEMCQIEVREAQHNDAVLPGRALIAPGGKHMMLQTTQFGTSVQVKDGPLVCRHKPSVDVLFRSVSKYAGANAKGIILTGMGDDGAKGMKEMHDAGAKTIAQDEATCMIYGMPKEAAKLGAIDMQVPLGNIPAVITSFTNSTF